MTSAKYPLGTIAIYGPNDKRASKLVAAVFPQRQIEPSAMQKWFSETEDVRVNNTIQAELSSFLKEHHVAQAIVSEEIMGCPHEEGLDYPIGCVCPQCPFWANSARPVFGTGRSKKPGRNDPCTCGSGKKYKKCCGP